MVKEVGDEFTPNQLTRISKNLSTKDEPISCETELFVMQKIIR